MITVCHDGFPIWECGEHCALCKKSTHFWYEPKDVAVCQKCATTATHESIPSKSEWMASQGSVGQFLAAVHGSDAAWRTRPHERRN